MANPVVKFKFISEFLFEIIEVIECMYGSCFYFSSPDPVRFKFRSGLRIPIFQLGFFVGKGGSVVDPDDFCSDPDPTKRSESGSGSLKKNLNNFI